MKNRLHHIIETLGLEQSSLGEEESTEVGADHGVAQGFVASEEWDLRQWLMEEEALDLEVRAAQEMGYRIKHYHERRELITVWPPTTRTVEVRTPDSDDGIHQLREGEVVIDFGKREKGVALVDEYQEGLVLTLEAGKLVVAQLLNLPDVPTLDGLETPLSALLEQTDDEWIIEEGTGRLEVDDPWEEVVALGHLIRHEEVEASARKARLEALLSGEDVAREPRDTILGWFADDVDETSAQVVATYTAAAAEGLMRELEELRHEYETGEPIDVELVRPVFERRDDLQSLWYILRHRDDVADIVSPPLEAVDEMGQALAKDYRLEEITVASEQLYRASVSDARRWWTALVWTEDES